MTASARRINGHCRLPAIKNCPRAGEYGTKSCMRRSRTLAKFRQNQVARLTCLYHPVDMFARHAANAGFDCIWIEAEHHRWEPREIQRMIYLAALADIDILIRAATREKAQLYQLLESGATGIIIPQVSSGAEAKSLVAGVRFPEINRRIADAGSEERASRAGETAGPAAPPRPSPRAEAPPPFAVSDLCECGPRAAWTPAPAHR